MNIEQSGKVDKKMSISALIAGEARPQEALRALAADCVDAGPQARPQLEEARPQARPHRKKLSHPAACYNVLQRQASPQAGPQKKKLSHPGCYYGNLQQQVSNSNLSPPLGGGGGGSRSKKKHSLPAVSLPVPVSICSEDDEEEDVTKRLESAVRKMSRGSSPNHMMMVVSGGGSSSSPAAGARFFPEPRIGLSGLARGYEQYRESLTSLRPTTEFGEPSSDDLSSEWESASEDNSNGATAATAAPVTHSAAVAAALAFNVRRRRMLEVPPASDTSYNNKYDDDEEEKDNKPAKRPSGWRKVRNMVQWTPFVQNFRNRKYQWVQLAGHSGNFKAGRSQGTVLKKLCPQEERCYTQFPTDTLGPFVPEYQGTLLLDDDDEKFIQLQDCLSAFQMPSIMDCKIGVRTYLEEELAKAKEKPKLRKDMYEKMMAVDRNAPSEEEHRLKGVTKPRYMVWRETISSTATLGFRIEGVKKNDGTSSKEFKTTKTKDQVLEAFRNFISSSHDTAKQYLDRLVAIRQALDQSQFFRSHELIGSSLLFVHDTGKACVWLIDFGKTVPLPPGLSIDHRSPWEVGNHEDGYLIGIQNLISIFSELVLQLDDKTTT